MTKKNITFTINEITIKKFKKECKKRGIVQSVKVEKLIDDWLDNIYLDEIT